VTKKIHCKFALLFLGCPWCLPRWHAECVLKTEESTRLAASSDFCLLLEKSEQPPFREKLQL